MTELGHHSVYMFVNAGVPRAGVFGRGAQPLIFF